MAAIIPPDTIRRANEQSRRLRELIRAPEILVMPGTFNVLTAMLFESLGFSAIQGTSGGIAATFGVRDGEVIPRSKVVEVYRQMIEAVDVPVNADGEKGYGGPEEVAETVRQLIRVGAAGMNLEDGDHHAPGEPLKLVPIECQLAKIQALLETRGALGSEFFLNARVDAFLLDAEPRVKLDEAIERGNHYAEHGGDCIFYLGPIDAPTIGTLAREVKAPISILAGPNSPSVAELEALGVSRVSYGTSFTRAALSGIKQLADVLKAKGDPSALLRQGYPSGELNQLLRDRWPDDN